MRHQLKAVFTNHDDAQQVLDNLVTSGFSPSTTVLSSPPCLDQAPSVQDVWAYAGFRKQLVDLFAKAPAPQTEGRSAYLPGRHHLTMAIATDPECVRAITILENSSALYIEDWRQADREPNATDLAKLGNAAPSGSYPAGTAPGSVQERQFHSMPLFGTQKGDASYPHGATYQESSE